MPVVLEKANYTYMPGTPYQRQALNDISLSVEKGEFVALVGHSGSGKSTLVQHMAGLLSPNSGQVLADGISLIGKKPENIAARRKVGIVFQYPEHQLFAETVFEDVAFGPRNMGLSEEEVDERVRQALAFVRLAEDGFGQRSPFRLSGGQMRRVAIAGVVAMRPDYLVLDEPSAGLDPVSRNIFYEETRALHKETGAAVIMVTHSMEEAIQLADRLLVMSEGKIILDGSPGEIFRSNKKELLAAGVDVPDIVALGDCLRGHGLGVSENCLSSRELAEELYAMLQQRGGSYA